MVYTILIVGSFLALGLVLFLSVFLQRRAAKSKKDFSTKAAPTAPATRVLSDNVTADQTSFSNHRSQQWFDSANSVNLTDGRATRMVGSTHGTESIRGASSINNPIQSNPGFAAYPRPQQDFSPLPPPKLVHAQHRYELEQEYERGMRTVYDERVGAVNFIGMHVVMNTPAEVDIAFHVCKRQIRQVLRARGLDHAPTLTDIGGIVIGRDATAAWGQALKQYLEEMCIKVGKDTYLLAHYNSQAQRPRQDELQEKIRRIQFMTSAAINKFQSNIFDTREEAVAFLLRMREVYHV